MKTLPQLTLEITRYHEAIQHNPDDTKSKDKLKRRLSSFADMVHAVVYAANNEHDTIKEDELKLPVLPMPLKKVSKHDQVGDYQFFIDGFSGSTDSKYGSFVVERKTIADLYGTLFSYNSKTKEPQRLRLYREIDRFYADARFDQFIVMVEGTWSEFLEYVPPRKACKHCIAYTQNPTGDTHIGICKADIAIVKEYDDCYGFYDYQTDDERVNNIINSKKATINALQVKPDVQVIFCDSRADMVEQYRGMIRQWVMQRYDRILGLDCGERAVKYFDND